MCVLGQKGVKVWTLQSDSRLARVLCTVHFASVVLYLSWHCHINITCTCALLVTNRFVSFSLQHLFALEQRDELIKKMSEYAMAHVGIAIKWVKLILQIRSARRSQHLPFMTFGLKNFWLGVLLRALLCSWLSILLRF